MLNEKDLMAGLDKLAIHEAVVVARAMGEALAVHEIKPGEGSLSDARFQAWMDTVTEIVSQTLAIRGYSKDEQLRVLRTAFGPQYIAFSAIPKDITKLS